MACKCCEYHDDTVAMMLGNFQASQILLEYKAVMKCDYGEHGDEWNLPVNYHGPGDGLRNSS